MQQELSTRCSVCGRVLSEPHEYGNRHYCERHLATFAQDIPSVWQASILTFAVLLLLVLGSAVAESLFGVRPQGHMRVVVGATVAFLPALLWLALLYRFAARAQESLSPLLPTVFVLAALVAAALTRPLLYELINLDNWLARANAPNRFFANILLGSNIHMFALYAIVRYTIWRTSAFERRVDGVLFALVSGWGYASMLNLLFVLDQGGLTLMNGTFRLIGQLCAFLSGSLVLGYFLGRNRFEDMPVYYLSVGIAAAITESGILLYAGAELDAIRLGLTSDGFSPWPGVVLSLAALAITYAAVNGLLRRHNALTVARLERTL